jgi:diguanylate cyclase (GGDEF)-like protein
MSDQSTSTGSNGSGERTGRLGRFRSKGASVLGGATPPPSPPPGGGDPVTGLPTREVLHEWLHAAIAASRPTSTRCILVFVDLASLRDVNDSFGPDAGDSLLAQVPDRLSDLSARLLRYGGAELAMVFQGVDTMTAPDDIAHAVLERLTAPYDVEGARAPITLGCHLGIAIGGDASGDIDDLVRDAHQALVAARDLGPASYVAHDESRRGRYTTRIDEARLSSAIDDHEFLLHYQPILRVDTGELIGVEALLRWQEPGATNTGMLFPHDFLPLLEKSGLIVPVGRWVVEETCRQAVAWADAYPAVPPLFVTCNVGAHQLAMPDFAESVLETISETGLPAHQLCLDITEQTLRYNGDSTWSALRRLKQAGVKLGLDDFGIGASSLTALRELNVDILRIDRTFIIDLADSAENRAIVRHVSNLAHELHMVTVAEGIETEEQAAVLSELGVDLAQGFLYGRPGSATQIDARLDPPDPEAPFTGPASDTSVFPPPVFPREEPPVERPATNWPPADWSRPTAPSPSNPAASTGAPGLWPELGGAPGGASNPTSASASADRPPSED